MIEDVAAEESVLGAMLMSPRAIDEAGEVLSPHDFSRDSHRIIFTAALDLHAGGSNVDAITLADELEKRGKLVVVGGKRKLAELAALVPAASRDALREHRPRQGCVTQAGGCGPAHHHARAGATG